MPSTNAPMDSSPQGTPAPAPSGAGPAPGSHPGAAGGAPPARATASQDTRQAAPGGDPLADFRGVFAEPGNEHLEKSLRDAMGIPQGDHELLQALETASSFFESHATDAQRQMLTNTGLSNDPQTLAFFHAAGQAFNTLQSDAQKLQVENARLKALLNEPGTLRTVRQAGPRGESQAMTNDAIEDEIAGLWATGILTNANHPQHAAFIRKLERLQKARYEG